MFEMLGDRKDETGKTIDWAKNKGGPRVVRFMNTYQDIETAIVAKVLPKIASSLGLSYGLFEKED